MKTSEKGVAFIAAREGIVTRAYRDAAGVWTIGVGHTAAAGAPVPVRGMVLDREEALRVFAGDLPRYEGRVGRQHRGQPARRRPTGHAPGLRAGCGVLHVGRIGAAIAKAMTIQRADTVQGPRRHHLLCHDENLVGQPQRGARRKRTGWPARGGP